MSEKYSITNALLLNPSSIREGILKNKGFLPSLMRRGLSFHFYDILLSGAEKS